MPLIDCPACGHPVSDRANQCPACGAALQTQQCPCCGATLKEPADVCPQCGEPLTTPTRENRTPESPQPTSAPPQPTLEEMVTEYKLLADEGNPVAAFQLGLAYYDEAQKDEAQAERYYKFSHDYFKKAAKGGMVAANYYLALLTYDGRGTRVRYADTADYLKQYIENFDEQCDEEDLGYAYGLLAHLTATGQGTAKNITKAYRYAMLSKEKGSPAANELLGELRQHYPLDAEGHIDLKAHGRTGLTNFVLIAAIIGCILSFGVAGIEEERLSYIFGTGYLVGMGVSLAVYLSILFYVPRSGWILLGQTVLAMLLSAMYSPMGIISNEYYWNIRPIEQFTLSWAVLPFVNIPLLLLLQLRKKGRALPWCSLTGIKDDGRSMLGKLKDFVMVYGEGEAYKAHSRQSKTFGAFIVVATVLTALAGAYVGYLYITSGKQWGLDIEWKCWKSPSLWGFLSFIGFFCQFFNWQHVSFDHGVLVKESSGREKFYKSQDVLEYSEGHLLYPLLMHVLVIPAMYGALFYYVIMGIAALIGSLIPYAIALVCVSYAVFFYRIGKRLHARRYRFALLLVWLLLSGAILSFVAHGAETERGSQEYIPYVAESTNTPTEDYNEPTSDYTAQATTEEEYRQEEEASESVETENRSEDEADNYDTEEDATEETAPANSEEEEEDEKVYQMADTPPGFPGGMQNLLANIQSMIVYPESAKERQVEGTVYVSFVIRKDGSIGDIKAFKSPDSELAAEAVRVVKELGEFEPAKQGGKPVNYLFRVPVEFRLGS